MVKYILIKQKQINIFPQGDVHVQNSYSHFFVYFKKLGQQNI